MYVLADTRKSTMRTWGLRKGGGTPKPGTRVCNGFNPFSSPLLHRWSRLFWRGRVLRAGIRSAFQPGHPAKSITALPSWEPAAARPRGRPHSPALPGAARGARPACPGPARGRGPPCCRPEEPSLPGATQTCHQLSPVSRQAQLMAAGRRHSLGTLGVRTVAKAGRH